MNNPRLILVITFLIAVITYSLWSYIKAWTGISIFYSGIALSFVGYTYVIKLLIIELSRQNTKYKMYVIFSNIINLATINNLIDEMFFDPKKLQVNEYLAFIILILISYGRPIIKKGKRLFFKKA